MSKKVKLLATYIARVHWKTHIEVEYKSLVVDKPKILFEKIQAQKLLFAKTEELSIMQQNCFFTCPENLILTMLGNEDKTIRIKALRMIEKRQ